jgi:hypothetical protein
MTWLQVDCVMRGVREPTKAVNMCYKGGETPFTRVPKPQY